MSAPANDAVQMQKEVATSADCEIEETFAKSLIKHRLCLVALPPSSVELLKSCANRVASDNANLLGKKAIGHNNFLEFGIKDSSATDPFTLGFRQLDRVARESFSAICRSKVVGVDPGLANALLDCYPLAPGVTTSSTLEVIQSSATTTATICDEHEDLGLITLIWSPEPGLHVLSADNKWLEVPSGADHVAVLPGRTLNYVTAGQVTCPMYRLVGGSPLIVAFMLRANDSSLLDCSSLMHRSQRPVPSSFSRRLTVKALMDTVAPDTPLTTHTHTHPAPPPTHTTTTKYASPDTASTKSSVRRDDTARLDQSNRGAQGPTIVPVEHVKGEPAPLQTTSSWRSGSGIPAQKFYACLPCANPEFIRTKSMTMSKTFSAKMAARQKK